LTRFPALLLAAALIGCEQPTPLETPSPPFQSSKLPDPRVDGPAGGLNVVTSPQVSLAPSPNVQLRKPASSGSGGGRGDIMLDYADTDIRDVVAQIFGKLLNQNYTIDPAVHGAATFHTATPLRQDQLIPTLQALLGQNGATALQAGGLWRVVPAAAAAASPGVAEGDAAGGTTVFPLHYAGAEDLAKTLQPFVQSGGRILADAGRNTLIISGDPGTRQTLTSLVRAFDVDLLAGQSYALFPVPSGDAKDFAGALQDAFKGQGGALSGLVRVLPMQRIGAVLVVSSQPRYIDETRRVYALVEKNRRQTVRTWHVYYLQNSRSNDTAYVLQQAFTPNNVTAQPTPPSNSSQSGINSQQAGRFGGGGGSGGIGGGLSGGGGIGGGGGFGGGGGGLGGGGLGGGGLGGGGLGGGGLGGGGLGGGGLGGGAPPPGAPPAAPAAGGNPLLGGLDPSEGGTPDGMRLIPNTQNNALLVYATPKENDTVETMLRKLDILPLQVRIDATIAEVQLNDTLQYGTQFFFKSGLQGALSFGTTAAAFASGFPGFVLSGPNNTNAALNLLQSITKVRVLSSPQLLVLDNEEARLQVGALVPYISQQSQSTVVNNGPIVNSIQYQQTGVIMQVTPRVNSGGLVTLDISQEVSDVAPNVTTAGVNSPTFNERSITSRVVIQDGQTVGLAGLIRDTDSRTNEGIPWLKDIPLLGLLASTQSNIRNRTELLVLITPHVVHDQRDAAQLTADLSDQLRSSAAVPGQLQTLGLSGSADPQGPLRRKLRLER
jgi:general secretion pathway protein D